MSHPAVDASPTPQPRIGFPHWHLALDLATSYAVSFVRAGAMLAIVALLSRRTTAGYFAAFLFLRAVLGILNNLFAGAGAAAIAALRKQPVAEAEAYAQPVEQEQIQAAHAGETRAISYEARPPRVARVRTQGYDAMFLAALLPTVAAFLLVLAFIDALTAAARPMVPPSRVWVLEPFIVAFSIGWLGRLMSDAAGGVLQVRRLLWLDNTLVAAAEVLWVYLVYAHWTNRWDVTFVRVGEAYMISGLLLWMARWLVAAGLLIDRTRLAFCFRWDVAARFLSVTAILALASVGDFLYAGANNLIINRMLDPLLAADYNPALQVDAVLLLAVAALASVLLPRAVAMHEAGRFADLKRAYIATTLVGILLLAGGAGLTLAFQRPLLQWWLAGKSPGTAAILPFVLAHTVLGGTGMVARTVMIGIGRFKTYTAVALAAGMLNALLGLIFVGVFGWGLRSLVVATIISVSLRVLVVFPWLIFRALRQDAARDMSRTPLPR